MTNSDTFSLIAIFISAFALFKILWQERKHLKIEIHEALIFKDPKKFDIFISFMNLSKLPIGVNQIAVYDSRVKNSIFFNNEVKHNQIFKDIGTTEILYTVEGKCNFNSILYNNSLPINIEPYSSIKDIIRLDFSNGISDEEINNFKLNHNTLHVKISTTRGIFWRKISMDNISAYDEPMEFYKKYKHHKKLSNKNID
ncbi:MULTISPECIES: hypothetical protein [Staphylococcus]|uniref:Uncharacterized protein n=1 Tax=Staphylococcus casei TaxID=201828 RepID=A0ABZ2WF07_9STAP|nr:MULTISPECIES: hypothetical protein [Staphylococcus]MDW8563856.1 hypothetical protein [Staphylococcus shinii]PKI04530.1 hypothetical protein CW744_10085 [Staphylococcus xylosus]